MITFPITVYRLILHNVIFVESKLIFPQCFVGLFALFTLCVPYGHSLLHKKETMEQQILNYRIEGLLGEGGMSRVLLGVDPVTGQKVAIKVLHPEFAQHEQVRMLFRREARLLAKLKHPNIVRLIRYEESELLLVQEYIEGINLEEYITNHRGPIPEEEARELFGKLLEAIGYVHQHDVIHRDIKPANILMTDGKEITVVDFGISKESDTVTESKTGTGIGTPSYMSPEQVLGEKLDRRTDIYSLGVVLHQMLTGKAPYTITATENEFKIKKRIVTEPLPRMQGIYEYVSKEMQSIVDKATAKDRNKRYQSCEEFLRAIRAVKIPPPPPPLLKPDWRLLAGVAVLLLIIVSLFAYNLASKRAELPVEPPVAAPAASPVPVAVASAAIKREEARKAEERRLEKARQEELAKLRRERDEAIVLADRLRRNPVPAPAPEAAVKRHEVGERYGGGIIFYVDATGQRGLIASKMDMAGHSVGFSEGDFTWSDAKNACNNLVTGGFSDWHLPTKDELNKLYLKKSVVGGFADGYYWSSTEDGADNAWFQYFTLGGQGWLIKSYFYRVRAVRAF